MEEKGTTMFLAICFQTGTAVAQEQLLLLCFSPLVLCHKTKMRSHYDPSTITLAELECACIMQLLCHSNLRENSNWEAIQLLWTQLISSAHLSIEITRLRSSNNVSIAVIKCTHRNKKTWGGSSSWELSFIIWDSIEAQTKNKLIFNNI